MTARVLHERDLYDERLVSVRDREVAPPDRIDSHRIYPDAFFYVVEEGTFYFCCPSSAAPCLLFHGILFDSHSQPASKCMY